MGRNVLAKRAIFKNHPVILISLILSMTKIVATLFASAPTTFVWTHFARTIEKFSNQITLGHFKNYENIFFLKSFIVIMFLNAYLSDNNDCDFNLFNIFMLDIIRTKNGSIPAKRHFYEYDK